MAADEMKHVAYNFGRHTCKFRKKWNIDVEELS